MIDSYPANKKSALLSIFIFTTLLFFITIPIETFIGNKFSFATLFIISGFRIWGVLLLIYLYTLGFEKNSFLLWTENEYKPLVYIKSIFVTMLSLIGILLIVILPLKFSGANMESQKLKLIVALLKDNFPLLLFTCLTAGITEELLFRGYLLPRLQLLFNSILLPVLLSSLFFGLLHFGYGTFAQVIGPFGIGLVLAIHYYKYRNLKIIIICHFLWDFTTIFLKTHF